MPYKAGLGGGGTCVSGWEACDYKVLRAGCSEGGLWTVLSKKLFSDLREGHFRQTSLCTEPKESMPAMFPEGLGVRTY